MMQYLNEAGSAAAAQPDSSRPAHYITDHSGRRHEMG